MKHFQYYPQIEYSDELATNLLVRGKIRDAVKNNVYVSYKYSISDSDRADLLASKYYGNGSLTWAIYYANDIHDPLLDWPMTGKDFNEYIIKRYGSSRNAKETVHHYLWLDKYIIDEPTYKDILLPQSEKKIVTVYDYENDKNEAKRNINIIDVKYIRQLSNELSKLFK